MEKQKLTKSEERTLASITRATDYTGKFKWIKIGLIGEMIAEFKNDIGKIRKAQEQRDVISLINKGYFVHKSNAGMWRRYVLVKQTNDKE